MSSSDFVNPIDADKTADKPGLLPYAHHVGSPPIVPTDAGALALQGQNAMSWQTDVQMEQIRSQMELLDSQATAIQRRKELASWIYQARMGFKPVMLQVYFLYQTEDEYVLRMVSPEEWTGSTRNPGQFVHAVRLLPDSTWDIVPWN